MNTMHTMRLLLLLPLLLPATVDAGHLITNETVSLNSQQVIQVHNPNTGSRRAVTVDQGVVDTTTRGQATVVSGYTEEEINRYISVFGHPPPEK